MVGGVLPPSGGQKDPSASPLAVLEKKVQCRKQCSLFKKFIQKSLQKRRLFDVSNQRKILQRRINLGDTVAQYSQQEGCGLICMFSLRVRRFTPALLSFSPGHINLIHVFSDCGVPCYYILYLS